MIIEKSLLNQTNKNNNFNFDFINYSLELIRENVSTTNLLIMQESIGIKNLSIENILISIVNGIIKVLKMILGKFLELLIKIASMGKSFELEIRAYKKKIENYNGSIKFEDSYKYTNIYGDEYENYPSPKLVELLIDDINDMISRVKDAYGSNKSFKEIQYKALSIKPDIDREIRVFRRKLLGETNNFAEEMSDEIFNLKCFKLFRNNQENPGTVEYKGKEIYNKIYLPYIEQRKSIDRIKKDNARIQRDIERSKSLVKDLNFDFSKFSDSEQQTLLQSLAEMQTTLCTIYEKKCKDIVTMYTNKLQAYKDFTIYSRSWLVKVMQQITYQGVVQ